jgi:hypothetical protein
MIEFVLLDHVMHEKPSEPIAPRSERDSLPERQLFNLGAMTDSEITVLAEALGREGERSCYEPRDAPYWGGDNRPDLGDELQLALSAEVVQLTEHERARGKALLCSWANSDSGFRRMAAADCAVGIARFDYAFAKDLAVYIANAPSLTGNIDRETARAVIDAFIEAADPEEAADLEARRWSDLPDGARITPQGIESD